MHNFNGVVGIIIVLELNEPIRRVLIGYFVPGKVHVQNWAALKKELPNYLLCASGVKAADVDGSIGVSVFKGTLISQ